MATIINNQGDEGVAGPLPDIKSFFKDDGGAPYTKFTIVGTYICNEGVLQEPVGTDDETAACAVLRVHAPLWRLILDWYVERELQQPLAPISKRSDPNLIRMGRSFVIKDPMPLANGQGSRYALAGRYTYMLRTPIDPEESGLPGIASVMTTASPGESAFPASNFTADFFEDGTRTLRTT